MKYIFFLLTTFLLVGCTGDLYRGVYEGIRNNNDAKSTPNERANSPPVPSYDKYKQEREKQQ